MNSAHWVELPVDFTVAQCRRVNPFHWALLQALSSFVPGARPDFDKLAERLRILEPAFLNRVWAEIVELKAGDDADFIQAKLTPLGEEALKTRYFTLGEPEIRSQHLYFKKLHGEILQTADFEIAVLHGLRAKPAWSEKLSLHEIVDALAVQAPKQALKSFEQLRSFSVRWQDAHEVKVTATR